MLEKLNNEIKEPNLAEEELAEEANIEESDLDVSKPLPEKTEDIKIVAVGPDSINVISSPKPSTSSKPGLGYVENGVMGSTLIPKSFDKKPAKSDSIKKDSEKVAIHSTKNVTWSEVGKVYRGYNIVTKEQADKWLTRDHTRIATPEEVAKEFNN
jgi:hypothetical protein